MITAKHWGGRVLLSWLPVVVMVLVAVVDLTAGPGVGLLPSSHSVRLSPG